MVKDSSKLVCYNFATVYDAVNRKKVATFYGEPIKMTHDGLEFAGCLISVKTPLETILRIDPIEGVEPLDIPPMPNYYADKPYFFHDCITCEFLGHTTEGSDVWFCKDQRTLLIRWSSEPCEYLSVYGSKDGYITNGDGESVLWREALPEHAEAWDMMLAKGYSRKY